MNEDQTSKIGEGQKDKRSAGTGKGVLVKNQSCKQQKTGCEQRERGENADLKKVKVEEPRKSYTYTKVKVGHLKKV